MSRLEKQLAKQDLRLPDDGSVRVAFACVEVDDSAADSELGDRRRLCQLVGNVLAASSEQALGQQAEMFLQVNGSSGDS